MAVWVYGSIDVHVWQYGCTCMAVWVYGEKFSLSFSGELIDDVLEVVANDDALVEITLQYRTLSDDASNSVLIFELPSNIFGPPTNEECSTDDNEVYTCLLEPIISSYEEV